MKMWRSAGRRLVPLLSFPPSFLSTTRAWQFQQRCQPVTNVLRFLPSSVKCAEHTMAVSTIATGLELGELKEEVEDCCSSGYAGSMNTGGTIAKKEKESAGENAVKRKKKMSKRDLVKKLKQLRWVRKIKRANMDKEQRILARIERAQLKISLLEEKLKGFELPPLPMPEHDPESLTAEEFHYLKKIAQKSKNYVPVGRRGVFGGVVQNMHLHWKKHQTVNVWCRNFSKEEVNDIAEQLARLSGGIVVDIKEGDTIAMYRGKNYTRPQDIIPKNTLTKRKALLKSLCEQALKSHKLNMENAEKELKQYREVKDMPPLKDSGSELEPSALKRHEAWHSESESVSEFDVDPALVFDSDSDDLGISSDTDNQASYSLIEAEAKVCSTKSDNDPAFGHDSDSLLESQSDLSSEMVEINH
eukprot:c27739_g2_i3 orf=414-1658(-)